MLPTARHDLQPCGLRRHSGPSAAAWLEHLPADWRDMVVAPVHFTQHREYEIAAARHMGYDDAGQHCYYHHDYTLTETRSDDDEDYYQAVTHGEHCGIGRSFYSFADHPPR